MARGRRKLKIQRIMANAARKAAFQKRRATLLEKAKELSTLCKVPVAMVVYGPGGKENTDEPPMFYPEDLDEAKGIMRRYMEQPEAVRAAHKVDNEALIRRQRLMKMRKELEAARAANRQLEVKLVINEISLGRRTGVDDLAPDLVTDVMCKVDMLRTAVSERIKALTSGDGAAGDAPAGVLVSSLEKPLMVTPLAMAPPEEPLVAPPQEPLMVVPPPVVADATGAGCVGVNEDEFPRNGSYLLEVADAIMDNGGTTGGGGVEATGEDVGRLLKENGLESFVKPKPM